MSNLPEPLVPVNCDCTDLDGFMLNVERLMASELVALSSHEVVAACLFVWCRAWKQKPAASLPDDDRVIAAFARLPLARFRKLKSEVLRGFVKCSDGRLYHRFLATEAATAFARKVAFRHKRAGDAERLRKWRTSQRETSDETQYETRFVAEGQGQVLKEVSKNSEAEASAETASPASARTELFRSGLANLQAMTGRPEAACRTLLGKWLKLGQDDAGSLSQLLSEAMRDQRADAVAWIEACLKSPRRNGDWQSRPEFRGVE